MPKHKRKLNEGMFDAFKQPTKLVKTSVIHEADVVESEVIDEAFHQEKVHEN